MLEALWKAAGIIFMATDFPIWAWPITLVVLAMAVVSIRKIVKSGRTRSRPMAIVMISSLVTLLVFPLFAVAFWADHGADTPESQKLPGIILQVMWWFYVAVLVFSVVVAKGYRLALTGFATLPLWFNFGVYFVCAMAISGLWL